MRWSERDAFFPTTRTIGFTQLTGDFRAVEGTWRCASGEDGTAVTFDAVFDLGIPTLAELLDPVAATRRCAAISNASCAGCSAGSRPPRPSSPTASPPRMADLTLVPRRARPDGPAAAGWQTLRR